MKLNFSINHNPEIPPYEWQDWRWQLRHSLKTVDDFARVFTLSENERRVFCAGEKLFRVRTTPYYARLAHPQVAEDPIRKIIVPQSQELHEGHQQMLDPLGENQNRPVKRVIHRYSDRALFLVTDFCSVYCRYCTRKHFTATDQSFPSDSEYNEALNYIRNHTGLREVIISGGDPLTLSDEQLERVLFDLRQIEHVEIIRLGSRMPVVCPMRVSDEVVRVIKRFHPVYMMTHFNHPREVTTEAAQALTKLVDAGVPVFNQMVLLNGVNNHPAIVQALSRRLVYLRVKPYYMFQADPSLGTDHLRTSVENSQWIQRELWGHLSGLAMPSLSLDIPVGGGKVPLVPDFEVARSENSRRYRGWDGIEQDYISPPESEMRTPIDVEEYLGEWESLKRAKS